MINVDDRLNAISKEILDAAFYIHTQLGPGLLESVYERCLAHILIKKGLRVECQKYLPLTFDNILIEGAYKLDLLIEDEVIVELKVHERILPVHESQLHTYLKLSGKQLGLILNFNTKSLKDGIKRIALTKNFA